MAAQHLPPATPRVPHRSPRWWRRFVFASRKANFYLILEFGAALTFAAMIWTTWYAFTSAPSDRRLLPAGQIAGLLIATLIPAMALVVLLGRRRALGRAARTTARLHVRLVFFFSLVAAVPTLLVAAFAAFLFQSGVDFWFSDNSRELIANTREVERAYYKENQRDLGNNAIAMSGDVRDYLAGLRNLGAAELGSQAFADYMSYQMDGRDINESALLQNVGNGSMRTAATYNLTQAAEPTAFGNRAMRAILSGEPYYSEASAARVEALSPIDRDSGVYLYVARNSEARSYQQLTRARSLSQGYQVLTERALALQLRFNLALFFVSLALVGLAVWFALRFADRQVEPLTQLVGAARRIGMGDFAVRAPHRREADEIGLLNRAFNRMARQIELQTRALVGANAQLENRRAFIEAIVESITAGIVSTDRDGTVRLMNSSAQHLLLDRATPGPLGMKFGEVAPQLWALAEAGLSSGIVQYGKGGELLTLAAKLVGDGSGFVITFEDITRQLLDQRQAAWSDVARRIAHEIKNPLTPIQLATERLRRRYARQIESDPELFDELTGTIIRQVGELRTMVDEFSSFARLPKPVFRNEDAGDLTRQALFLQEVAHPEIDYDFAGETNAPLQCDRHQFGQAVTNVLKNAAEAIDARARSAEPDYRGRIRVELGGDEHSLTITVADNGVGLPKERERIVEPYMTTREKGTGLGLAIVNKIVEEHGGEMTFAPAPGGGTVVTISFARDPLRASEGQAAAE